MYNGIGLETARGSGTNGYVHTNKFSVRQKTSKPGVDEGKGFGTVSKKPNTEILEHDRKRQIELQLVLLEDKFREQGCSDVEINVKVDELREKLETVAAVCATAFGDSNDAVVVSDTTKMSDTKTHQVAARKEKQMEKLRAAFGITVSDADAIKQNCSEHKFLHDDENMKADKHHDDEATTNGRGYKRKHKNKRKGRSVSVSSDLEITEEKSDSESDF